MTDTERTAPESRLAVPLAPALASLLRDCKAAISQKRWALITEDECRALVAALESGARAENGEVAR